MFQAIPYALGCTLAMMGAIAFRFALYTLFYT